MSDRTKIKVWMPFRGKGVNRVVLYNAVGTRAHINYADQVFTLSKTHLKPVIEALAHEFGAVEVTLEFNENEQCDTRCQSANPKTFFNCTCSCLTYNHGGIGAGPGWLQVGETTLIRPGIRQNQFVVTRAQVTA